MVAPSTESLVRERAGNRCEYCKLPQSEHVLTFHVEHVLAMKHVKDNTLDNLALACPRCNGSKGTNIAGMDVRTRKLTRLFNPRTDRWSDHFSWNGPVIKPRSAIGRVTVHVLDMNNWAAISLRDALMQEGLFF